MRTNAKVYVMRAEDGTLKLGHSTDPVRRSRQIGRHVEIVHQTNVLEHAEVIERLAHRVMALHGKHLRGEWFEGELTDAIQAIEIAIRQAEGGELPLGGRLESAGLGRPRKSPELLLRTVNLRLPQGLMDDIEEIHDRRPPETDMADVLRELLRIGVEVENSKRL